MGAAAFGIHHLSGLDTTWRKNILNLVGGIPTPLKNMSQLGLLFPIYGNIKHVPNHQPVNTQVPKISQHILWLFPSLFASDLWLLS